MVKGVLKMKYIKPEFEVVYLTLQDVITVSDVYIDDPKWFL